MKPKGTFAQIQDSVSIYISDKVKSAVGVGKMMATTAAVGGLMAGAGLLGGLSGIALAGGVGAAIGLFVPKRARFGLMNAAGCSTTCATAALIGATGPIGLIGGAVWGAGLAAAGSLISGETKFG